MPTTAKCGYSQQYVATHLVLTNSSVRKQNMRILKRNICCSPIL